MTTTEKLAKIRARCVELLAIAEKRTPGKWTVPEYDKAKPARSRSVEIRIGLGGFDLEQTIFGTVQVTPITNGDVPNATFIAACAGAAEAGWRATISAIDLIEALDNADFNVPNAVKEDFISAWEDSL
jgi:hypothetical protein